MSGNPYAPPVAPVAKMQTVPSFFAVSTFKLAVMSLCTLGLYEIYWFYMNWHCIRNHERSRINPALRSVFGIFYAYPCFSSIRKYGDKVGIKPSLLAGPLTAGWILSSLIWALPGPYSLISMFAFAFLLPVQTYVNRINDAKARGHDRNTSFSGWNWLAVILGGGILTLALIGTFLQPQPV